MQKLKPDNLINQIGKHWNPITLGKFMDDVIFFLLVYVFFVFKSAFYWLLLASSLHLVLNLDQKELSEDNAARQKVLIG